VGRILKRLLKVLGGLAVLTTVTLYIIANHSAAQRELTCSGHWRDQSENKETAYVQLNEYRWWVRLWSDRQGNAVLQTDKRALSDYIPDVRRIHDGKLALYMFHEGQKFKGGYRAANKEITIEFMPTAILLVFATAEYRFVRPA